MGACRSAGRPDGGHDVAAVGRDLRHEPEALDGGLGAVGAEVLLEGTPADDVLIADGHVFGNGNEGVQALVVLRAVEVDAERLAVARKGMAVGAGGEILHHRAALGLADVAQRHLMRGMAKGGSGWIEPFFRLGESISGTSR